MENEQEIPQTDIQAFLKKLQDEIEAGKNLVNMDVNSSIALTESNPFEETMNQE